MTHVGYLVAGWGGSVTVLGAYAAYLIARGRMLSASVPPARRRWMSSEDGP